MSVDVKAVVHEVLGSHGDETILEYIVGEQKGHSCALNCIKTGLVAGSEVNS